MNKSMGEREEGNAMQRWVGGWCVLSVRESGRGIRTKVRSLKKHASSS